MSQTFESAFRPVLDLQEGLPTRPGPLGGTPHPSRTSGRDYRPVPDLREGLLTRPRPMEMPLDPSWTYGRASRTSGRDILISGMASQPFLDHWKSLPTCPGHPG